MQAFIFSSAFMGGFSMAKAFYCTERAIALLAVRTAYANLRSGAPFLTDRGRTPGCSAP